MDKLSKSKVKSITSLAIPEAILRHTCKSLYEAGLNVYQISDVLGISSTDARNYSDCGSKSYPDVPIDINLVDKILYDANVPVATDTIIRVEKDRYRYYAEIEAKSLEVMLKLLNYYNSLEEGDLKTDSFKASLASSFIKATQQCREELLKKYAIDKHIETSNDEGKIRIEFIEDGGSN